MFVNTPLSGSPFAVHSGLPGYLRASLRTAAGGGSSSYEHAGYQLGRAVHGEVPYDIEQNDWDEMLAMVDRAIDEERSVEIAAWLAATFPRVLALVPARRRRTFVSGFCRGRREFNGDAD